MYDIIIDKFYFLVQKIRYFFILKYMGKYLKYIFKLCLNKGQMDAEMLLSYYYHMIDNFHYRKTKKKLSGIF